VNRYQTTLRVVVSETGEEIPPALLTRTTRS